MGILAVGINHNSASVDVRGQVAFAPEAIPAVLQAGLDQLPIDEVALLCTCNRTEIYCHGDDVGESEVLPWLAQQTGVTAELLQSASYSFHDAEAVRHLMRVASGMDSLILGEPQILGQLKSCYVVGREQGAISSHLNNVFEIVFAAAKRVRRETAIGQNPVSVAFASVKLAQQIFSELKEASALLIGAGETIRLVARHLRDNGIGRLTLANRTLSRAEELAAEFDAHPILLAEIPDHLHRADIVISSTASQLPILGKGAVESALKKRKRKPIFMVDIAVPRDIEPEVEELKDVFLYTVDDLEGVVRDGMQARRDAANLADEIIANEVENWGRQQRALAVAETIRAFRGSVENIRDAEVEKALAALRRGQNPDQVLRGMARNLTNKLMHTPTTRLRKACEEGRDDTIHVTHELFDLKKSR